MSRGSKALLQHAAIVYKQVCRLATVRVQQAQVVAFEAFLDSELQQAHRMQENCTLAHVLAVLCGTDRAGIGIQVANASLCAQVCKHVQTT